MSLKLVFRSIWHNPGNKGKRLHKTAAAVYWQLYKRVRKSPRLLILPNGLLFKAYPDCVVSSALIYSDWPEYQELAFIRSRLKSDSVVIDVGAYVGHISLLLADIVGWANIFAFEPTPITYARLAENWALNGWDSDKLFPMAIGANPGGTFIPNTNYPESKNSVTMQVENGDFVPVSLASLDSLRPMWQDRHIGLLKIDVEGYEREVLQGSMELLQAERPSLIMFESLSAGVELQIVTLLRDCRYTIFQLDDKGCPDFEEQWAQNLFAIPVESLG